MQTHPKLTIRRTSWSNPVGRDLRAAQQAELDARYGHDGHEAGDPPTASDIAVFLIAYERATGQPLGCGGLLWLGEKTAEVKRVYVLPYARGSGVASSILLALEAEAHDAGITLVLAEAGSAQPDGKMFYEAAGYREVPNFGPYQELEESVCYSKPIIAPVRVHAVAS